MNMAKTGKFIASLRQERRLNQTDFGELFGVTNKTVSRWETGAYMPPVEILELMSRELGVTINEIVAGERAQPDGFEPLAEKNLCEALGSAFDLRERQKFFEKRWNRSHAWLYALLFVAVLALVAVGVRRYQPLAFVGYLLGGAGAVALRNARAGYVERRTFEGEGGAE